MDSEVWNLLKKLPPRIPVPIYIIINQTNVDKKSLEVFLKDLSTVSPEIEYHEAEGVVVRTPITIERILSSTQGYQHNTNNKLSKEIIEKQRKQRDSLDTKGKVPYTLSPILIMNWGIVLYNAGLYEEAIQKYREADKIKPKHANILVNWGSALYKLGRFEEAIQKYQQADKIRPEDVNILYNWGVVLAKLKNFKEAKKMFQQAATAAQIAGDIVGVKTYENYAKNIEKLVI